MKKDLLREEFDLRDPQDFENYMLKTRPEYSGLDMLQTYLDASKDRVKTIIELEDINDNHHEDIGSEKLSKEVHRLSDEVQCKIQRNWESLQQKRKKWIVID